MGTEFQMGKTKRVLEMDGGDGWHNDVNVHSASELYA